MSSKSPGGPGPGKYPSLYRAAGRGHHQRPAHFRHGRHQDVGEDRQCINLEIWDATKLYDRMGIDSEVHRNPGHPGAGDDHSRQARAEPGRHHRGGRHEQPGRKKMGYNAAQELLSSLGVDVSELQGEAIKKDLDI